jgi:hypothetical protein
MGKEQGDQWRAAEGTHRSAPDEPASHATGLSGDASKVTATKKP